MAGNVDDGKSTLTGRLLFDTGNITRDQLNAIKAETDSAPDLARLTDGLKAEREQGITIDVAYKYFSTGERKFIIADAPGHIQYTRNMITGASTAGLVIILIDARHGITEQTKRHSLLVSLLGIPQVAVVVNKIDLVDYSEAVFRAVVEEYASLAASLNFGTISYIPVSALNGDNVVNKSANMPWYDGKTLLEMLETVPSGACRNSTDAGSRMYVQYVITATENGTHHRGYAGRIISGSYRKGDKITVLPSGVSSRIKKIYVNTKEVEEAAEGDNIVLVPEDERDIGRGDMIVSPGALPSMEKETEALVFWMDQKPLKEGDTYILQVNARTLRCRIEKVYYKLDINTFKKDFQAAEVRMNDVAKIKIRVASALLTDSFVQVPANGRLILIDETSYITAGACVIN
jgi:sulfate adenylyltransferase subunit 1